MISSTIACARACLVMAGLTNKVKRCFEVDDILHILHLVVAHVYGQLI